MSETFVKGLKFAFKRSNSPVAYCALSVNSGTRDENKNCGGLAHLTEHLLFKGTETRNANTINSYIEKLGGELNAYTTKEETVIHATVLKHDIAKAVDLLVDLAFRSTFPEKELDKEKTVVLDEVNSYKDSPSDLIYDDFEEYLFSGSALSMPVLGKVKYIKKITVDKMREYYCSKFIPENMSFSVVADLEEKKVVSILSKALDKYMRKTDAFTSVTHRRETDFVHQHFYKIVARKNHQEHCVIGAPGYSQDNPKRFPLILLVNILGGPAANSRLNMLLREKNALVYNVDASYNQYFDTGAVTIYFGSDKSNGDKCEKLVLSELARFREKRISEKVLREAKNQLIGQLAISYDNGEAQCLSMGKSLLSFGRVIDQQESINRIKTITADDILEVAREVFAEDNLSTLKYI